MALVSEARITKKKLERLTDEELARSLAATMRIWQEDTPKYPPLTMEEALGFYREEYKRRGIPMPE